MKNSQPKRAKLISDGGLYRYLPIKEVVPTIHIPVMRRIKLRTPEIDHDETWKFELVYSLERVTNAFAEYRQIDAIKVINKQ